MRKLGLLIIGVLVGGLLHAQNELVPDRRFDLSNGLPAKLLYHIVKDKDGFLWLACENGVFRFDGKNFYPFTIREGLCDNEIVEIQPDRAGNIWCAGYNAKISVIRNGVVDTTYPAVTAWKGNAFANSMTDDNRGNIYFVGMYTDMTSQLLKIRPDGKIQDFHFENFFYPVRQLLYRNNKLYVFGYYNYFDYDTVGWLKGKTIGETQVNKMYSTAYISEEYRTAWGYKDDRIFDLFTGDTLNYRILPKQELSLISQVDARYLVLGFMWGKTLLYDLETNTHRTIKMPEQARLVDAIVDNQDNLWLVTANDGIYQIRNISKHAGYNPLPEIKGNIQAVSRVGRQKFAVDSHLALFVWKAGACVQKIVKPEKEDNRETRYCSLLPSKKNVLVFTQEGLFMYGPDGKFSHLSMLVSGKDALLYKDSLLIYRHSLRIAASSLHDINQRETIYPDRAYAIKLQGHRLWASITDGLICYDIPQKKWSPVLYRVPQNGRIEDMEFWGNHVLALATSNKGIICLDTRGHVYSINTSNGLFNNDCKQIIPYAEGWLVRHAMGFSLINLYSGEIRTVSQWGNLAMSTVNRIHVSNDTVLVASSQGVWEIGMKPLFAKLPERRQVAFLRIVSQNNRLLAPHDILLDHTDNRILVNFSLPEYGEPDFVQYNWRINNGSWNKADGTSLEFVNLAPGDYTLHVKAKAPGFDWSPVSTLHIHVKTPFWRTWWFIGCVLGLLLGLVWYISRRRYRRKLANEREKASVRYQLMDFEQKALNAMMNPHFVFNAMGSIQHLLNTGQNQQANDYLVKFSRLIRKSLETSQLEFCYLDDEIERLTLYLQLEKMRFGGRMDFSIDVASDVDAEQVKIPTMILQTYVENAIIHGAAALRGEAWVRLTFARKGEGLAVSVEDNGPGFDVNNKAKRSVRFGVSATEKRLELLTQITGKPYSVNIVSPVSAEGGTRVELLFSIKE